MEQVNEDISILRLETRFRLSVTIDPNEPNKLKDRGFCN